MVESGDVGEEGLAAVLFDMDGTLVDSEKVWNIGLRELAAGYGGVLSAAARVAITGTASMTTARILHADLNQPWRDPYETAARLDARMRELFATGLEWRPGARELLGQVRAAGLQTALVTNTSRALAQVALGTIGADNFDAIVCGDEVTRTKPDPEPYLAAAAALGVAPRRCVAIEDSPAGVASARAAGCAVIAVPHDVDVPDEAGAGLLVVTSLALVDVALLRSLVTQAMAARPSDDPRTPMIPVRGATPRAPMIPVRWTPVRR